MKLGIVSALFSYAGLPQWEALERISAFGIPHVDILTRYDAAPSFWSDPGREDDCISNQYNFSLHNFDGLGLLRVILSIKIPTWSAI